MLLPVSGSIQRVFTVLSVHACSMMAVGRVEVFGEFSCTGMLLPASCPVRLDRSFVVMKRDTLMASILPHTALSAGLSARAFPSAGRALSGLSIILRCCTPFGLIASDGSQTIVKALK